GEAAEEVRGGAGRLHQRRRERPRGPVGGLHREEQYGLSAVLRQDEKAGAAVRHHQLSHLHPDRRRRRRPLAPLRLRHGHRRRGRVRDQEDTEEEVNEGKRRRAKETKELAPLLRSHRLLYFKSIGSTLNETPCPTGVTLSPATRAIVAR